MKTRDGRPQLSRRKLIASALATGSIGITGTGAAQTPPAVQKTSLDGGLEVRDYRIFPSSDIRRFIVELHNATDQPIDTPNIGVILDHLPKDDGYGFAASVSPVLYPHTSTALFGVAPLGLEGDDDWGIPQWILCSDIVTTRSEEFGLRDFEQSSRVELRERSYIGISAEVTNNEPEATNSLSLCGEVYDPTGRICGILSSWRPWWIEAGETQDVDFHITPDSDYIGNPFVLLETGFGVSAHLTLQPKQNWQFPSCPAVMPWNR